MEYATGEAKGLLLRPTVDVEVAASNLESLELAPAPEAPAEVVADKGYHARAVLKRLEDGPWTTRIAEPARRTVLRWHGDDEARRAVYANRRRLLSGVARVVLVLRAVLCERTFAHCRDALLPGLKERTMPAVEPVSGGMPDHAVGGTRGTEDHEALRICALAYATRLCALSYSRMLPASSVEAPGRAAAGARSRRSTARSLARISEGNAGTGSVALAQPHAP